VKVNDAIRLSPLGGAWTYDRRGRLIITSAALQETYRWRPEKNAFEVLPFLFRLVYPNKWEPLIDDDMEMEPEVLN
jgi:hypothetical protein